MYDRLSHFPEARAEGVSLGRASILLGLRKSLLLPGLKPLEFVLGFAHWQRLEKYYQGESGRNEIRSGSNRSIVNLVAYD